MASTKVQRFIGGHVSCSRKWKINFLASFKSSVIEALSIGANCFALYLKSSRQWSSKIVSDKDAADFKLICKEKSILLDKIVPHGSLLLNCGSPKPDVLDKSRSSLIEELKICQKLGISLYNFHPGNFPFRNHIGSTLNKISRAECIAKIAMCVNEAIEAVNGVVILLENSAGQGGSVGHTFEELRQIIDQIKDKSRIGICFDTCHAFAAVSFDIFEVEGYDISTESGYHLTMEEFDKVIGLDFLKAFHINDSKGIIDRHETIGKGKIGIHAFELLLNDGRFEDIPMVLETPLKNGEFSDYSHEIKILKSLIIRDN
ncbi:LOW QUALITY PROTEIN: probable endonuclease 4 [Octopus sinensis]|uniref:LOW QUALITY PROTEIN: probable endonuclease 4 n=1 Tax=Octopus sinensis TaxID=2607531 RepID=A0A6P7U4Q6_9MOLL|nr:LOW QUALITY PROTEIN: probable endonuclease 4 [Octopus sinensis]